MKTLPNELTIQTRKTEDGVKLAVVFDRNGDSLPLHENNFATIYNIDGHKVMLGQLGYPNKVVNLLIHLHLIGQHQFRFAFSSWDKNPCQAEWVAKADSENPPNYIGEN